MSKLNNNKKQTQVTANGRRSKKRFHWTTYVFVVAGVLILVPALIIGGISLSAMLEARHPINGNRFFGDLDPKVTSQQLTDIETSLKDIADTEKITVDLNVATLRINIKTTATITAESYAAILNTAYQKVIAVLPAETYFTQNLDAGKNMYDLQIDAYNQDPAAVIKDETGSLRSNYIYFVLTKSSLSADTRIQEVSVPIDAAQAQALRDAIGAPSETVPSTDSTDSSNSGA